MGGLGAALFTLLLICAQVVVSIIVSILVSRFFLVTLVSTASGNDEVEWPDEPMLDWIAKPFYLLWVAGIWLAATMIGLRIARPPVLAEYPMLQFVMFALPGLWLFFPVSMLSSLSASSPWLIFNPGLIKRLVKVTPSVLGFYLLSLALYAVAGGLVYAALLSSVFLLVPVAAAVLAAAVMIYARLLGRLGLVAARVTLAGDWVEDRRQLELPKAASMDPWEMPAEDLNERMVEEGPVVEDPLDGPVHSYGVSGKSRPQPAPSAEESAAEAFLLEDEPVRESPRMSEGYGIGEEVPPPRPAVEDLYASPEEPEESDEREPPRRRRRKRYAEEDEPTEEPDAWAENEEDEPRPRRRRRRRPEADEPDEDVESEDEDATDDEPRPRRRRRRRLREGRRPPPPLPAQPLLVGTFNYPWYPKCIGAWGILTIGFTAQFIIYRFQVDIMQAIV